MFRSIAIIVLAVLRAPEVRPCSRDGAPEHPTRSHTRFFYFMILTFCSSNLFVCCLNHISLRHLGKEKDDVTSKTVALTSDISRLVEQIFGGITSTKQENSDVEASLVVATLEP